MRAPVSYFMTIVLLIHAAVGCCWHHQHQCVTSCCEDSQAIAHACPCDDRHGEDAPLPHGQLDEGGQPGNSQHRHEHDCDGDRCTFVRSERSPEECGKPSLDAPTLTWTISRDDRPIDLFCSSIPRLSAARLSGSLRHHLALSVLLI